MISKVLVAVKPGFTDSPCLQRAKVLAQHFKFELLLYSVVHENQFATSGYGTHEALENTKKLMLKSELSRLAQVKSHFDGLCSTVSVQAQWQTPVAQAIANAATAFGADLILISGSLHGRFAQLFMAHTDWEVIRRTNVPALISQDPHPKPYQKVLAAMDPTHRYDQLEALNHNILRMCDQLREAAECELYVGHVYPPQEDGPIEATMPPKDERADWREFRRAAVEKLAENHEIEITHIRQFAGSPVDGIVEIAQALGSDLVVMGALSRTFRAHRILGTIAEKVLHKLDCDLLFVPLDDK